MTTTPEAAPAMDSSARDRTRESVRAALQQGGYLTTRDVAQMFRTSESTIRYWRHKGIGPRSFRAGRRVLYDLRDVEAHIDKLRADSA